MAHLLPIISTSPWNKIESDFVRCVCTIVEEIAACSVWDIWNCRRQLSFRFKPWPWRNTSDHIDNFKDTWCLFAHANFATSQRLSAREETSPQGFAAGFYFQASQAINCRKILGCSAATLCVHLIAFVKQALIPVIMDFVLAAKRYAPIRITLAFSARMMLLRRTHSNEPQNPC